MSRYVQMTLILAVLVAGGRSLPAQEKDKDPGVAYQAALDYLGRLDPDRAYRCAGIVLRDFPESKEAGKARLLKVMISTMNVQSFDLLRKRYAVALEKALLFKDNRRSKALYVEATEKMVGSGKVLVEDIEALFEYVGRPMTVEIKKDYDGLDLLKETYRPYKILDIGFPPTEEEKKKVERLQYNMSLRFVLGRMLSGLSSVNAKEFEKKRVLKGDVDWVGCVMAVGDWLVHHAAVCKVGWLDHIRNEKVEDPKQARSAYETARRCFEKAAELSKKPRDRNGIRARERIKEIDRALREMR